MPYVELASIQARIPQPFLVQALDDDQDGAIDAGLWELIAGQTGDAIDARLGQRFAVPLAADHAAMPLAREAALVIACELIYARRVAPDQNPWTKKAEAVLTKLDKIGAGEEALTPTATRARPSGSVIAEPSRTYSERAAI